MMNEIDKILELLDKEELSESEKTELQNLISTQPDSEKIIKTYNGLKNLHSKNSHIDEMILGEYVLYKNNMLENESTILLLQGKIEKHLRKCNKCTEVFKTLNAEYSEADSFIEQTLVDIPMAPQKDELKSGFSRRFSTFRIAFASIAVLAFIYIGMFAASSFLVPDYKRHAISESERNFYNTRGRTSELFQKSLSAIESKNLNEAIKLLEEDIAVNQNDASIFYSHFILGVTYIQSSESSFLGTFKSFDKEKVEKGIDNLKKSIKLNTSGRYENLNLDAHYFIGRGYMLIDDYNSAIQHFEQVVENKGSYYKKAEDMLSKISKR